MVMGMQGAGGKPHIGIGPWWNRGGTMVELWWKRGGTAYSFGGTGFSDGLPPCVFACFAIWNAFFTVILHVFSCFWYWDAYLHHFGMFLHALAYWAHLSSHVAPCWYAS